MDDLWKYGLLGGGLSDLSRPVTANQNMLAQAYRARQVNPRPQLEGYQAGQMAGMFPGLGLIGVLGDAQQYVEKPETRGILNYGLTALGALPFLGAMAKMAGPMPRGILKEQAGAIAYHGSPHQFDKFDASKIGSGEGAQAYGHGLYFAENPATAKTYAADRSYVGRTMAGVPDSTKYDAAWIAKQAVDVHGDDAAGHLEMVLRANSRNTSPAQMAANKEVEDALALVRGGQVTKSGNLYKVDLPDEQIGKMLDWDKPLSQQPESVRKALGPVIGQPVQQAPGVWQIGLHSVVYDSPTQKYLLTKGSNIQGRFNSLDDAAGAAGEGLTGATAYGALKAKYGDAEAAKIMRDAGIPGIRYLDQGSRTAGEGTRNFVVFDDSLPKILERR